MAAPAATFVIATYRRVQALRCTLRSLQLQRRAEWEAVIVGDCCGPETAETVRAFAEPRFRYYNFPGRFGEQSGPNSFGLHLARGAAVAFLNHDDLLLPDHLERGLAALDAGGADFWIGRGADATRLETGTDGAAAPVCTGLLPRCHDLSTLVLSDPWLFDPSSFWLVRADYARTVGAWRPSTRLYRTPLRDWLMRAWRLGGRFAFGDQVTGLRFWTQNLRSEGPLYAVATPEHDTMVRRFETESPDAIRAGIDRQIAAAAPPGPDGGPGRAAGCRLRAFLYLNLGLDLLVVRSFLTGRPRGALHRKLIGKRTGEAMPGVQSIDRWLADPEACRVV